MSSCSSWLWTSWNQLLGKDYNLNQTLIREIHNFRLFDENGEGFIRVERFRVSFISGANIASLVFLVMKHVYISVDTEGDGWWDLWWRTGWDNSRSLLFLDLF